ncbi:MAG: aldo/keto reductase, partial [Legionella sp.]
EQRLGDIGVTQWHIVSKLPIVPDLCSNVATWVIGEIHGSLRRLKISKLYGLLLHQPSQLLTPQGDSIYRALLSLKEEGKIDKLGVSVYDPEELQLLLHYFKFDLVQAPFNIFDRRFSTSGWLRRLHQAGIEIHTRSAFLQGLLLMELKKRPAKFSKWQSLWEQWHTWLEQQALTPIEACIGFVQSQTEIDKVIVGVESDRQMRQILGAAKINREITYPSFETEDLQLLNPSNWVKA